MTDFGRFTPDQIATLTAAAQRWGWDTIPATDADVWQLLEFVTLEADLAAAEKRLVQQACDRAIKTAEAWERSHDDFFATQTHIIEMFANGWDA